MDWQVVNGITGIVSAIAAVVSVAYIRVSKLPTTEGDGLAALSSYQLASFIIVCSGWALCCLAGLWVFEPFGSYPSPSEYQQLFGVILALPALILLKFGVELLHGGK